MDDPNYRLIQADSNGVAIVEFNGWFQQVPVVWRAEIHSLFKQSPPVSSYIEIFPITNDRQPVVIGLPLQSIDHAVIIKTIKMMRGYKRLALGRHEFGN